MCSEACSFTLSKEFTTWILLSHSTWLKATSKLWKPSLLQISLHPSSFRSMSVPFLHITKNATKSLYDNIRGDVHLYLLSVILPIVLRHPIHCHLSACPSQHTQLYLSYHINVYLLCCSTFCSKAEPNYIISLPLQKWIYKSLFFFFIF